MQSFISLMDFSQSALIFDLSFRYKYVKKILFCIVTKHN